MINWKEDFLVRYIFKDILTSFCETSTSFYFIYHNLHCVLPNDSNPNTLPCEITYILKGQIRGMSIF